MLKEERLQQENALTLQQIGALTNQQKFALGIAVESPERGAPAGRKEDRKSVLWGAREDLERKARPEGERPKISHECEY